MSTPLTARHALGFSELTRESEWARPYRQSIRELELELKAANAELAIEKENRVKADARLISAELAGGVIATKLARFGCGRHRQFVRLIYVAAAGWAGFTASLIWIWSRI